jgi:hypothetical protein
MELFQTHKTNNLAQKSHLAQVTPHDCHMCEGYVLFEMQLDVLIPMVEYVE